MAIEDYTNEYEAALLKKIDTICDEWHLVRSVQKTSVRYYLDGTCVFRIFISRKSWNRGNIVVHLPARMGYNRLYIPFTAENEERILAAIAKRREEFLAGPSQETKVIYITRTTVKAPASKAPAIKAPKAPEKKAEPSLLNSRRQALFKELPIPEEVPDISGEHQLLLINKGKEFWEAYTNLEERLYIASETARETRPVQLDFHRKYVADDKMTLDRVADGACTREAARQRIKKANLYLKQRFSYLSRFEADAEFSVSLTACLDILEDLGEDIVPFFVYALPEVSVRRMEFAISLFWNDQEQPAKLLSLIKQHKQNVRLKSGEQETKKPSDAKIQELADRACYPTDHISQEMILPYPDAIPSDTRDLFLRKCKKDYPQLKIMTVPSIIFHTDRYGNDLRPDFLLEFPDGRRVLTLVYQSSLSLATKHAAEIFNALHLYCKRQGFGYLIFNGTMETVYELRDRALPTELSDRLEAVLEENGRILWEDILNLRKAMPISHKDIATYVLQKKLAFHIYPFFTIKKRHS